MTTSSAALPKSQSKIAIFELSLLRAARSKRARTVCHTERQLTTDVPPAIRRLFDRPAAAPSFWAYEPANSPAHPVGPGGPSRVFGGFAFVYAIKAISGSADKLDWVTLAVSAFLLVITAYRVLRDFGKP